MEKFKKETVIGFTGYDINAKCVHNKHRLILTQNAYIINTVQKTQNWLKEWQDEKTKKI